MCYSKLFSWQWQQEQHLYFPTLLHCVNFWYYKVRGKKRRNVPVHTRVHTLVWETLQTYYMWCRN